MNCQYPGCTGTIEDGFCDTCGRAPAGARSQIGAGAAPTAAAAAASANGAGGTGPIGTGAIGTAATGAMGSSLSTRSGSARSQRSTRRASSSRRRAGLGAGLIDLPAMPTLDPLQSVMANPVVPERKRSCQSQVVAGDLFTPEQLRERGLRAQEIVTCGQKLTYERGFCPQCGREYTFIPTLKAGDLVAGKYEVKGPMTFGGLGWIYIAWDRDLGRWVVMKGLLNAADESQAQVALAERRALAAVKHPNIVGIYDFVSHTIREETPGKAPTTRTAGFIVMEYIGGKTVMSLRKERGPLPAAEAIAYILGIVPAFAFLHAQGLAYMDFKPENVMLEGDRVVLIDMGAVHSMVNPSGDLYATVGYSSPEGEPTPTHDVFTIARALAVVVADFKFQSEYEYTLPPAKDAPAFTQHPSLYRFLEKATRRDPALRFQTADEMAEQMRGVLRLIVATSEPVEPSESAHFAWSDADLTVDGEAAANVRALPTLKVDPTDPGAPVVANASVVPDPQQRVVFLRLAMSQFAESAELPLHLAGALIEAGSLDDAEKLLNEILATQPAEWRARWLLGRAALLRADLAGAHSSFKEVDAEVPGELAPKLALALVAEARGDLEDAAGYYQTVWRTDPSFTSAAFGLARSRRGLNDLAGAAAALAGVPPTSARYVQAQMEMANVLMQGGSADDLGRASRTLEGVRDSADPYAHHGLCADLLLSAAARVESAALKPDPATQLFGTPLQATALRSSAEAYLRRRARYAPTPEERIALIDHANSVRPRTLV